MMEVLCAVALLLFMWLTIMSMFGLSVGLASSNKRVYQASALTEKKLEDVNAWAQTVVAGKANFLKFGTAADPYLDSNGVDGLYPDFTWRIQGDWEKQATEAAELGKSVRKILVTVSWVEGTRTRAITLGGLVSEPVRTLDVLTVAVSGTSVKVGNAIDLSVTARDTGGEQIPDLTYRWIVLPRTADGTLSVGGIDSHVGKQVRLTARTLQPDPGETTGTLTVKVTARCGGVDVTATTPTITVIP